MGWVNPESLAPTLDAVLFGRRTLDEWVLARV